MGRRFGPALFAPLALLPLSPEQGLEARMFAEAQAKADLLQVLRRVAPRRESLGCGGHVRSADGGYGARLVNTSMTPPG
jgi:hypothetical protein